MRFYENKDVHVHGKGPAILEPQKQGVKSMTTNEMILELFMGTDEDSVKARELILARLPMAEDILGPLFEKLSRFRTRLDIEAIQEMQKAGLSQEQAVMLRLSANLALGKALVK